MLSDPCQHGMAHQWAMNGGDPPDMEGHCKYIE